MKVYIKILGTGCTKCRTLEKITAEVVKENGLDADLQKILSFIAAVLFSFLFLSCRQAQTNQWQVNPNVKLQVYFFHMTDRCPACIAIENNTKKVLEDNFKTQMDNGIINFASFNIDKKENKALAEKYQISYTSLLLVRADGAITDLTNDSFNYANTKPLKFQELLKSEIDKNLE